MNLAKIEIEVLEGRVKAHMKGNPYEILDALTDVIVSELSDNRKPGVTNEQLAAIMQEEILTRLDSRTPVGSVRKKEAYQSSK